MSQKPKLKIVVQEILEKHKDSRDCDIYLYARLLKKQGFDINQELSVELLKKMKDNKIPTYDTITRLRRQLQEDNESLRGTLWEQRHNEKQLKALKKLGYPERHYYKGEV